MKQDLFHDLQRRFRRLALKLRAHLTCSNKCHTFLCNFNLQRLALLFSPSLSGVIFYMKFFIQANYITFIYTFLFCFMICIMLTMDYFRSLLQSNLENRDECKKYKNNLYFYFPMHLCIFFLILGLGGIFIRLFLVHCVHL